MPLSDILFDDQGKRWITGSLELQERHAAIGAKFNLATYLVQNCSHVRIRLSKTTGDFRISFRLGCIVDATLLAVAEVLLDSEVKRYVLDMLGDNPRLVIVTDAEDAVAILVSQSDGAILKPAFFRQTLSAQRLNMDNRLVSLKDILRLWIMSHGELVIANELGLSFSGFGRQYLARIVSGRPQFDVIGRGYTVVDRMISEREGKAVDDQPDQSYGAWVAECLLETEHCRMPTLELIEAIISPPGCPPFIARYERLLLPWRLGPEVSVSSTAAPRVIF